VPPVWAGFVYSRLKYGLDFRRASPQAALAHSSTPVLLIHGLKDKQTQPELSEILAAANPRTTRLWLVPGAGHTGAYTAAPQEFENRVVQFYGRPQDAANPSRFICVNLRLDCMRPSGALDVYQNLPPGIQVREK